MKQVYSTDKPDGKPADTGRHKIFQGNSCTFGQKWGDDPFTKMGHTQVPNALIEYAARIGLAPDECWLISCILKFKYDAANPYPAQDTLARLYGRSVDTVQRVAKSIEGKGLLRTERTRDDLGHYKHTVYDFTSLRAALNECYYQDHPQERPRYSRPAPMPQPCGVEGARGWHKCHTARLRHGNVAASHAAKTPSPTPQGCGTNQSPNEKIEEEQQQTAPPAPPEPPQDDADVVEGVKVLTQEGIGQKQAERLARSYPLERIQRQVAWLPSRTVKKSPTGALVSSIMEDWPAPDQKMPPGDAKSRPVKANQGDTPRKPQAPPEAPAQAPSSLAPDSAVQPAAYTFYKAEAGPAQPVKPPKLPPKIGHGPKLGGRLRANIEAQDHAWDTMPTEERQMWVAQATKILGPDAPPKGLLQAAKNLWIKAGSRGAALVPLQPEQVGGG